MLSGRTKVRDGAGRVEQIELQKRELRSEMERPTFQPGAQSSNPFEILERTVTSLQSRRRCRDGCLDKSWFALVRGTDVGFLGHSAYKNSGSVNSPTR